MENYISEFMHQVNSVLERNLDRECFSTEDLAREVFLCRMQLYRRLRRETGQSASEYMRNYRLKKAEEMLRHTSLSITDITYEVGFSWPPYFTKCFKACYGICPTVYRQYAATG